MGCICNHNPFSNVVVFVDYPSLIGTPLTREEQETSKKLFDLMRDLVKDRSPMHTITVMAPIKVEVCIKCGR